MNTAELLARLRRHYIKPGEPMPGGVFLDECGWNGQGGYRRCDALYVGFTTTSGRILIGHELKVSRADWLHELDQNGKSDQWADECHEWWLVVSDPTIVCDGELPAGWGLMAPGRSKTRLQVHQGAHRKPLDHTPGWHAVRSILARQDTLRARQISNIRLAARDEARRDMDEHIKAAVAATRTNIPGVDELRDRLRQIEEALGGQIDWHAGQRGYIRYGPEWIGLDELKMIADAVRAAGTVREALAGLTGRYAIRTEPIRRAVDELDKALKQLKEAH